MRLLLDTHILVWFASEQEKLSSTENQVVDDRGNELLISTISIWELRTKWRAEQRRGRDRFPLLPQHAIDFAERIRVPLVPLLPGDCALVLDPPIVHADPFDEMLLIHADRLGARLLTRDRHLRDHPLALAV